MSRDVKKVVKALESGETYLGIELGSTRIKAVLIDGAHETIASGGHEWTNSLVDGIWTYSVDEIWQGIQAAYAEMAAMVEADYGVRLSLVGGIGFSAMMHGYMAFNQEDQLLVPFRTWRNNLQGQASEALTKLFEYPIPQRWSIAHLYQAVLNGEEHVKDVEFLTTLAGYVHWQLTGEKKLGVGEASGMFPIDLTTHGFNKKMMAQFDEVVLGEGYGWQLEEILPEVLVAGQEAGLLTEKGAKLLDPSGVLKAGVPFCPAEGDAGTGMVATNSVARRTGNVSAGTSVFAMVVLEKDLNEVHPEIDQVTTPAGDLVAMAHSNNCTSDLNAWVGLFGEAAKALGAEFDTTKLFETLYTKSLEGAVDCDGIMSYGYLSGEHITHFEEGRPMVVRKPETALTLANFMRSNLYSALGALKIGMDILMKDEGVQLDEMLGHGGLFKTEGVGQRYMAAAVNVPVSVMATAGEGGAWGMALLAAYMKKKGKSEELGAYLSDHVFADMEVKTMLPDPEDVAGFEAYMTRYKAGLKVEKAAVENL